MDFLSMVKVLRVVMMPVGPQPFDVPVTSWAILSALLASTAIHQLPSVCSFCITSAATAMAKANVVNVNVGVLGHVDSGKTSVVGGPRST